MRDRGDTYINQGSAVKTGVIISVFRYNGVPLSSEFERVHTDPSIVAYARGKLLQPTGQELVYFAHPQPLYGTEEERGYIRAIENYFNGAKVVNPGELTDVKIRDMGFYLDIVQECNALVYVRLLDRILGGVGLETEFAFNSGKGVYELAGSELTRIHRVPEYLDREGTVEVLKAVGFRK